MSEEKAPVGFSVGYRIELRSSDGKLIYAEGTDHHGRGPDDSKYERWRATWCQKNRAADCPPHIRDGSRRDVAFMLTHPL